MRARATVAALTALAACGDPGGACPLDRDLDADDCATLAALQAPAAPPPSPTNAHADDPDAAILGFLIFFDGHFSTTGSSATRTVRCATCHAPETHFDDSKPVALGIAAGPRNSPTVLGAARRTRSFFWDGRADVLWAPPILAMENPTEMGFTRLEIAHTIANLYADKYAKIWGPLPPLDDAARFPAVGKPGDAAFDGMTEADQDAVNRVAANVGKSLEAYLRKLATGTTALDRYLAGERDALTAHQQRGMTVFVQAGCATCHGGPLLADGGFHDLGVPTWDGAPADPGRAAAIDVERAQLFSPSGPYSDAPQTIAIADATPADRGAIRTPSLRNVAVSGPYMHNGRFATLAEAIAFHPEGAGLGADDLDALVDFLGAMTGAYPEPPWNDWPDRP